ncbi:methyltransferase domain-containing protein [Streptosporangium sp. NPDC049078]|uniref:class I SAM-dependent methyltransferase n=1 Tax=Streptosporangium sp. NPDC049078 TaxID=3155767 RepID=UPI00342E7355
MDEILLQVRRGERFAFGRNWKSFVDLVDESRVQRAIDSLRATLEVEDLAGRTFLDVGCGSGLFSLAAHRLGARVHSFDSDAEAVESAVRLRHVFAPDVSLSVERGATDAPRTAERRAADVPQTVERGNIDASRMTEREVVGASWTIERASILDDGYLAGLGTFDVVYSWGVLHHTGAMWRAFDATVGLVAPGGLLFVSLYNDQGRQSRAWTAVKRRYNRSGPVTRCALVAGSAAYVYRAWPLVKAARLLRGRADPTVPPPRGMSRRHDMLDWVGGYPFEVSKPEQVLARARAHDLSLLLLKTCGGGLGCNEYLLGRPAEPARPAGPARSAVSVGSAISTESA